jgi:hypothetical protein
MLVLGIAVGASWAESLSVRRDDDTTFFKDLGAFLTAQYARGDDGRRPEPRRDELPAELRLLLADAGGARHAGVGTRRRSRRRRGTCASANLWMRLSGMQWFAPTTSAAARAVPPALPVPPRAAARDRAALRRRGPAVSDRGGEAGTCWSADAEDLLSGSALARVARRQDHRVAPGVASPGLPQIRTCAPQRWLVATYPYPCLSPGSLAPRPARFPRPLPCPLPLPDAVRSRAIARSTLAGPAASPSRHTEPHASARPRPRARAPAPVRRGAGPVQPPRLRPRDPRRPRPRRKPAPPRGTRTSRSPATGSRRSATCRPPRPDARSTRRAWSWPPLHRPAHAHRRRPHEAPARRQLRGDGRHDRDQRQLRRIRAGRRGPTSRRSR